MLLGIIIINSIANKVSGVKNMAKTMTFAGVHFTVAFYLTYALTGDALIGSVVALIEPAINTVAFYFHELVWKKYEADKALSMNLQPDVVQ
jgi:uncharacterized membrane protein